MDISYILHSYCITLDAARRKRRVYFETTKFIIVGLLRTRDGRHNDIDRLKIYDAPYIIY